MNTNSIEVEIQQAEQIISITSAQITSVLCYNLSLTRKFGFIGTEFGFCLVDNNKKSFKRFQKNKNPFHRDPDTGIIQGTVLQQRTQVAIVPSKQSKHYKKNTVYIFDYQLQTILYSNDFFLPIRQITLTDDTIIVSNNRRMIIYNYSNDTEQKTQDYYLKMYQSREPNKNIRYFQMLCGQKLLNNSLPQFQEGEDSKQCICGKYVMSGVKPYKILYSKVYSVNGTKMIELKIYDWGIDKDTFFASFVYNQPFSFAISENGQYISYTESEGKIVSVRKIGEKQVFCNLWISSSIKKCIGQGFFIEDDSVWYTIIRKGDDSSAHMHFFKLQQKKQEKELLKSRYSRYFSLYEKTIKDYNIAKRMIAPQFYINNGAVFAASLSGAVTQIIDFKITGNHPKKNSQNFTKWREQQIK